MSDDSIQRTAFIQRQVKAKYERMLHPPVTYLGDAFKYRTVDGKFNNALLPHLGQAGAPYAKTVPSKTHQLGAMPDPGDIFDRLMARDEKGRASKSGLSSMLIYHATIIIHDIFRTNDKDKNISDTSSYLDLSPLYGFTEEMQRKIRDDKYKLGLLKPDTFAEDRLLRQPPGVCIMLVMYNRYHNYVATQLRRINENGRFSVPADFAGSQLASLAEKHVKLKDKDEEVQKEFQVALAKYKEAWEIYQNNGMTRNHDYTKAESALQAIIDKYVQKDYQVTFKAAYDAAWDKLDEDLFQTARLITCGMYIQISVHDYLRALMGFHNWDTNFTLEPRMEMKNDKAVTRGLGNQVTVEFNLLYRFHCAISMRDEDYTLKLIRETYNPKGQIPNFDPKEYLMSLFLTKREQSAKATNREPTPEPWELEFGLGLKDKSKGLKAKKPERCFERDPITNLFNDQDMVNELLAVMDDPISNFGPRNVPQCLKAVEIMAIFQARKWETGTLNDFRDFFGLKRHETFESITPNLEVQNALRDLYDHPDKVELYPGIFCESDKDMDADPGPSDVDSALWAAIFSDAITLVRSDRFYTVDWNTKSLTSWGMKEVTEDNNVLKSSVFHRLLQRAFPGWFPYDSIHFFHPFYTTAKNAELAQAQGYVPELQVKCDQDHKGKLTDANPPVKPQKPLYLSNAAEIDALLSDQTDIFVHPARLQTDGLPRKLKDVLDPKQNKVDSLTKDAEIVADSPEMMKYFTTVTEDIIKRETLTMDKTAPTYQIDITRE
jgi:heme peroxidase